MDEGAPMPPTLDLDDAGLTWRREGAALVVERAPTLRAVALPGLVALGALGLTAAFALEGNLAGAAILGLSALLALAFVWLRAVHRYALHLGSGGLAWEQRAPRHRQGAWPRDALTAVRLAPFGAGRWNRSLAVEVLVGAEWIHLAHGHARGRAEALAEALAAALGAPPPRLAEAV